MRADKVRPQPSRWGELPLTRPRRLPPNGELVAYSPVTRICVWNIPVSLPKGLQIAVKRIYIGDPDNPPKDGRRVELGFHGYGSGCGALRLGRQGHVRDIHTIDSFANQLAARGTDLFLPQIGGDRFYTRYIQRHYGSDFKYPDPMRITFDYIVQVIIPRIIDKIQDVVEDELHLNTFGHSLGGTQLYAYQSLFRDSRISTIHAIASPVRLRPGSSFCTYFLLAHWLTAIGLKTLESHPLVPLVSDVDVASRLLSKFPRSLARRIPGTDLVFADDVDDAVAKGYFKRVLEPPAPLLTLFLAQMMVTGRVASLADSEPQDLFAWLVGGGQFPNIARAIGLLDSLGILKHLRGKNDGVVEIDYGSLMKNIETPILVTAGGADTMVPPDCALPALSLIGSKEKHSRVFDGSGHLGQIAGDAALEVCETSLRFQAEMAANKITCPDYHHYI